MTLFRVHIVDEKDNSNIGTEDIEVGEDEDANKKADKLLKSGQAIDAIVRLAEVQ